MAQFPPGKRKYAKKCREISKSACNFLTKVIKYYPAWVFRCPRKKFIAGEVFGLPNIKSAKKRVLIAEVRNARNKANKSALKTAIKKFEAAAVEGNRTEAEGAYKVAVKSIDKAAAKGLMHKNNAAHKKSALTLKLNQIG